jgi:hypothetical protein
VKPHTAHRKILMACLLGTGFLRDSAVFVAVSRNCLRNRGPPGAAQWQVYFASDDPSSVQNVQYLSDHGVTISGCHSTAVRGWFLPPVLDD